MSMTAAVRHVFGSTVNWLFTDGAANVKIANKDDDPAVVGLSSSDFEMNSQILEMLQNIDTQLRIANTYSAMGFSEELTPKDMENSNAN